MLSIRQGNLHVDIESLQIMGIALLVGTLGLWLLGGLTGLWSYHPKITQVEKLEHGFLVHTQNHPSSFLGNFVDAYEGSYVVIGDKWFDAQTHRALTKGHGDLYAPSSEAEIGYKIQQGKLKLVGYESGEIKFSPELQAQIDEVAARIARARRHPRRHYGIL